MGIQDCSSRIRQRGALPQSATRALGLVFGVVLWQESYYEFVLGWSALRPFFLEHTVKSASEERLSFAPCSLRLG